ncbi:MAG: ribosomal-processing cysteine protease Prp [Erysipelothrix sp.]
MIKVSVLTEGNRYKGIRVSGHAYSGEPGFDLVCAGVSTVMIGSLNAFSELDDDVNLKMNDSPLVAIDINQVNDSNQLMFKFMLLQLKTIEETYPNYINIHEKEVSS